mgnify:FL=1
MAAGSLSGDEQAVSEMASVITLVAIAFVIVFAIGANVLFFEADTDGPDTTISFQYFEELSALQVSHDGGEEIRAGDLLIQGPQREVTWAEIDRGMEDSSMVESGDAIRLGDAGAYGETVGENDRIVVLYANVSAETTVLAQWNGTRG